MELEKKTKKFCVAVFAYELPASVDLNLFEMLEKAICNLIKFPLNFLLSRGNEFFFSHHQRVAAAKEILLSKSLLSSG